MFQSTHSLRSATLVVLLFSIRDIVSIHALLAECDHIAPSFILRGPSFQSTHSLRSATRRRDNRLVRPVVSIHALLAECDPEALRQILVAPVSIHALLAECDRRRTRLPEPPGSFNPRTPCGVRPLSGNMIPSLVSFQSTHSLRSATPSAPRRFQSL